MANLAQNRPKANIKMLKYIYIGLMKLINDRITERMLTIKNANIQDLKAGLSSEIDPVNATTQMTNNIKGIKIPSETLLA